MNPFILAQRALRCLARPLTGLLIWLLALSGTAWSQCFTLKTTFPAGTSPVDIAIADLNADGKADLVTANFATNYVTVSLGNGDGTFQSPVTYPVASVQVAPVSVVVFDANGDGKLDLATANYQASNQGVSILLGNGDGTFQSPSTIPVPARSWIATGDVNKDGLTDLIASGGGGSGSSVLVLLSNGDGTFQVGSNYPSGADPRGVDAGDLNNDGYADAVTNDSGDNTISVFLNKGDGTFFPRVAYPTSAGDRPFSVKIADLNGDGKADIVTANRNTNNVSVFLGNGDGTFQPSVSYTVGNVPNNVNVGDVNFDMIPDIITANTSSSDISVLLGKGDGSFSPAANFALGNKPNAVALGDLNGDGKVDLATVSQGNNSISVLLNCINTAPVATPNANQTATVGTAFSYTVNAFTDDTPNSLTYTANISPANNFTFNPATRVISGTPTSTGVSSVTITATDPGSLSASTTFTISVSCPLLSVTLTPSGQLTCATKTVTLMAGGGLAGAIYQYSTGATNNGAMATVTTDGPYSVTVTNPGGCSATAITTVSSNTVAPQNVTLSSSGTLTCTNTSVNLLAGSTTQGVSYSFTGPGVTAQNGSMATANQEGSYMVKVTGTNGCTATQTTQVQSNTTASSATLTNNGPITCTNRSVTLTAGGGGSYAFSSGAAQQNGGNQATVTNEGTYTVTVTNTTNGCSSFTTTTVSSNTTAPGASLTNNGPITCNQRSVTLTAGGERTYAFSQGATANGSQATVTNEGPYSVTVTGANGCTATQTTTVSSNTTAPTATLGNNGPLTANQPTVTLNAGGGNTYQFSSGASQQGGGNTATVNSPGTYQVTVTGTNGCTAIASTVVTGAVSGSSCRNGTGVITVVATGIPVKYEWYRNSINSARLTENPAQVRGTSTASLTLVNQQVTADYYVRVTDANGSAVVYGPFRFTVNLGCNIYARQGAEEVELRISLLGNPVQGDQLKAVITGAEGKALNVQLIDLSGRPIYQQAWQQAETNQSVEWSLSSQASGAYLLQATIPDQRQSVKLIKE